MSLINGMLRDLEARKSERSGAPAEQQQIRAVALDAESHWGRWYLLTGVLFLALVGWIFLLPLLADQSTKADKAAAPASAAASLRVASAVFPATPLASTPAVTVPIADDKPAMTKEAAVVLAPTVDQKAAPKAAVEVSRVASKAAETDAAKVTLAPEATPRQSKEAPAAKIPAQALPQKHFMQSEETSPATLAMNSARQKLEKGDLHGAIETLEITLPEGGERADYQTLLAALLQRDEQHKRAIDHFLLAVKKSPQIGVLWLGLGISRQALQQDSEAQEAFKRAKASNTLSPELQAFVEARLVQLSR